MVGQTTSKRTIRTSSFVSNKDIDVPLHDSCSLTRTFPWVEVCSGVGSGCGTDVDILEDSSFESNRQGVEAWFPLSPYYLPTTELSLKD